MPENVYWSIAVQEARDLVAASKGNDFAFVGVLRAKAVIAIDTEVHTLRAQLKEKPSLNVADASHEDRLEVGE
jgi:hypothetical protein